MASESRISEIEAKLSSLKSDLEQQCRLTEEWQHKARLSEQGALDGLRARAELKRLEKTKRSGPVPQLHKLSDLNRPPTSFTPTPTALPLQLSSMSQPVPFSVAHQSVATPNINSGAFASYPISQLSRGPLPQQQQHLSTSQQTSAVVPPLSLQPAVSSQLREALTALRTTPRDDLDIVFN